MLWAMMRFYLLSIALVFCGYTNGFNVWNRTSILDWQAGRSNVTWSQAFQLATPGQLELPSRKGPNGNDGKGNFGNAVLISEVQPAQRDSSLVQSSGGVAHIKQILNAYGQATPSHQPNNAPQSSRFYWNEFIKPGNCGPLPSQQWPAKNLPGFQSPSSFQPAGTINQVSESGAQSPYQPNSTPVSANLMPSSLAQSSSQSVVTTNQISASQTQLPYQTSATSSTISVSTSQSDSTVQPQGSNRTKSSETAKWYRVLQGKMIPSSSQVLGFQTQLYQPSSPTQLSAGQSASTFQAPGPSASTPYQGQALSWHVSQDQSIPSSQSVVTTNLTQSSYQPNIPTQGLAGQSPLLSQSMGASNLYQGLTSVGYLTAPGPSTPSSQSVITTNQITDPQAQYFQPSPTTQALAGQSAISQDQSVQALAAYPLQASGWYTISQSQIPSQVSGFQAPSYQPSTATPVLPGQAASPVQSMGASKLYQGLTSGRYLTLLGQNIPSSQSVIPTSQITDAQAQSFQPSPTTQALAGQSAISQDQSLQASATYPLQASGWYTTSQGQTIPSSLEVSGFQAPSFQPNITMQVLSGQSAAQDQSFQASTSNLPQTSGWYTILLGKMIPSSQVSGVQTGLLIPPSSTQGLPSPSPSTAPLQPLDASTQYLMQGSSTSQNRSNTLSSQSVVTTNQISGIKNQTPCWANTTWTTASQSGSLSQGSYVTETSGNAKWYSVLQGQIMPSSSGLQVQPFQPSTSTQVLSGQSASVQSMGDSTLYQGLTFLGQNIPPSPQPVATTNQISGFQNTYWPNTPVSSSQTISFPQSSSASQLFQGQTSGMSSISQDQSIPSSSQSVDTSSQIISLQTQSSFQPSTTAQVLTGQSASAQDKSLQASYPPQTSGWYTILQGQIPSPAQVSGFQAHASFQPSTTPRVLMGQSALAPAQSLGNSPLCSSQAPGWYPTLLGKLIPSSQMSGFQNALQHPSSTSQPAAASQAQSMGVSPLYQSLTSNINLTSQSQRTPSSFQSVAALNQITGLQNQSTYWSNTIELGPSQSAFTPQIQSSSVAPMYQVPAEGLPNTSQDQSITSLQSVPSTNQISGFQNQTSYWPSATWVLPGYSHIAQTQSLGDSISYPSQTSGWYSFLQSKIPSSQVSGHQASKTQILTGQSDSTALLPSLGPMLYQGQALSRNNTSQQQSSPSYFPSVATNQISGTLSQSSFQPSSTTVASASKPSTSQGQFSGASAWYQGPAFGSLTAQSQNIPSSSQSVVFTNQFSRFQNVIQPNTAQALSQSASTPQGITFQGTLPLLSRYGKKWPVTQ